MNMGNNSWFENSVVLDQGQQISRMRAIETGRSVVRVDNVGLTGVIDAFGVQRNRLTPYRAAILETVVEGRIGSTPFVKWGEWPWVASWLLFMTLTFILAPRRTIAPNIDRNASKCVCPPAD